MIKNEREYKSTRSWVDKFQATLKEIDRRGKTGELTGLALKAHREANESFLGDLLDQLKEYDALRNGAFDFTSLEAFELLPETLIKARIARNWTQRDLAERIGTTEQQVQKYESTDYASASLSRVLEIVQIMKPRKRRERGRPKR